VENTTAIFKHVLGKDFFHQLNFWSRLIIYAKNDNLCLVIRFIGVTQWSEQGS